VLVLIPHDVVGLGVRAGVGGMLVLSAVLSLRMERKREWIDGRMGVVVLVGCLLI